MSRHDQVRAIQWTGDHLRLLDQRRLPTEVTYLEFEDATGVASAIADMVVRGAPAIGITAAYAVALAARQRYRESAVEWQALLEADLQVLAASRPTAVNLFWALELMRECLAGVDNDPFDALLQEARRIHDEDIAANYRMGELGGSLIDARKVLTHCNTGSLATGGYGTALGVIRNAYTRGVIELVYADETRPWLQGSRLTAWELVHDEIPVTLICEGAAASLMHRGDLGWVIVGADRVAANGDVANKIGTYSLAVNARHHGVKFMVVAPSSTLDVQTACGDDIPVEMRPAGEICEFQGRMLTEKAATAWNPAFDVTPAQLVDVLVTEKGVIWQPDAAKIAAHLRN